MKMARTSSVGELIQQLAQALHTCCSHMAEDCWWPIPCPPPDVANALLDELVLWEMDAPGLSARVRVSGQPTPAHSSLEGPPGSPDGSPDFWARVPRQPQTFQRFLLVEFSQLPVCTKEELEQAWQDLESGLSDRYFKLKMSLKTVPVEMRVGSDPSPLPKWLQRALRTVEKRRFNYKKPAPLPGRAFEAWSREIQTQLLRDNGEPIPDWVLEALSQEICIPRDKFQPTVRRALYIEPDKQMSDAIFFLLALVLLQEGMIPEAEVEQGKNTMVDYLHESMHLDFGTAYLVLDRLQRHFTEPQEWLGLEHYIKRELFWTEKQYTRCRVYTEHRETAAEDASYITVDHALARFVAEGLPASRSTLFRWAQTWALVGPLFAVYDEHGGPWLTHEGMAKARTQLQWKALTKLQRKHYETARKFTYRHKRRGDNPEDLLRDLLSGREAEDAHS